MIQGGDVIPPLRRVTLKGAVGSILGPEYHWRSRPSIETERLFEDLQGRNEVAEGHREHDEESALKDSRPFTTFDPVHREAAIAAGNLAVLMEALEQAQQEPAKPILSAIPVIPTIHNDQAIGLQILADASSAPPVATQTKVEVESKVEPVPGPPEQQSLKVPTPTLSRLPEPSNLSVPKPSLSRAQDQYASTVTSQPAFKETMWPGEPRIWPKEVTTTGAPNSFKSVVLQSPFSEAALPVASHANQGLQAAPSAQQPALKPQSTDTSAVRPEINDFWSNLARGESPTRRIELSGFPGKEGSQSATAETGPGTAYRDSSKTTETDFSSATGDQNKAHGRPPLPGTSTILEPFSQRMRSTSDSFGPLLNGPSPSDSQSQSNKSKAPKKSLWGPWPRGRNYDPLGGSRRASTASSGSQEGYNRSTGGSRPQGTPDSRYHPYSHPPQHPGPGYPTSGPYSSGYPPPPPMYAHAPPPPQYGYDPRGQPYQPPPYGGPTGFAGLPGAPMTQAPPPPSQYYAPPPPQGGYQGAPMTTRPSPNSAAYGPQYGGQPILPAASHDLRYGQNGAPPPAGPAFAQFQNNDDRRRRNQSFGDQGGKFRHYYGPR